MQKLSFTQASGALWYGIKVSVTHLWSRSDIERTSQSLGKQKVIKPPVYVCVLGLLRSSDWFTVS
jgi:hypothetical protein